MIDELLRIPKEKLLSPLARSLRSVDPTAVTITACLVGVGSGVSAALGAHQPALGLWLLNRLLDGLDGTLARVNQRQSDLGAYLDIVLDNIVYAVIPLGIAIGVNSIPVYLALGFLLSSYYINNATWMFLSALLEKRSQGAKARRELTSVTMPGGLIEGLETFVFYIMFLLFPSGAAMLFWVMGSLVVFTSLQRILWAVRHLKS